MRTLLIAGVVVGLGALAGCAPAEKGEVRQEVQGFQQQIGNAAENARRAATDAALEGKVKAALESRKGLDTRDLNVDANGTSVILKGDVPDQAQADLAERIARETEGVEAVDNQLMLRVPARQQSAQPVPGPGATAPSGTTPAPAPGY